MWGEEKEKKIKLGGIMDRGLLGAGLGCCKHPTGRTGIK